MTKKTAVEAQTLKIPKVILLTAKLLEVISPKLVTLFAAKLFTTPIKHKIPKREHYMDRESKQHVLHIPSIKKDIHIYHYGAGVKKILLVHGWSGRGTQLVKIADEFLNLGYSTISFDAPAHGKSKGNSSIMLEFIESILEIDKEFGPFEFAVGHSLGGMSILNAIKQNLELKKAIIIGSGDVIQDIIDDFIKKLEIKAEIGIKLRDHFEKKYDSKMDFYSASNAAKIVSIPVLIIHDENDEDVNVKAAFHIKENLKNSCLMITKNLGHRKILGNNEVITKIVEFIN
ncbi:alpha/beta hydrolase [Flavobacterium aquatile]|uniref:Alpha/beta hydrolase n=1 Tax=Flavobacterium aquatile LMG 4008 = ATCC 11947 TaxID=1453498 RepID=A0A095ST33_9FLAO|nr:alpha/beta hydrolase [Flavobacterium aquatile]KGD67509.1 alpha/beta hydrolase [Flavobacterium aquatile LMG 4008 = ATCC 11947]OXA65556.1 alpha/beta hydrolase [Flavobacterium aquatile] [Flavobacterium aquatile LMG 4008 = ATCC 11947]GEC79953.1 alpha/beta hydrolase [Flavobacterium aquatile]